MSALEDFRRNKDDFMRDPESPLPEEDRPGFKGLAYFPENSALSLDLPIDTNVSHDLMTMETSDGRQRMYRRAGRVSFTVDGKPAVLNVYEDEHGYFLPFRDATSGRESYGAGRYLEPELKDGKLYVDFNYAYNPYCAYSPRYSCPLPPGENWLKVPIAAGEQKFKD